MRLGGRRQLSVEASVFPRMSDEPFKSWAHADICTRAVATRFLLRDTRGDVDAEREAALFAARFRVGKGSGAPFRATDHFAGESERRPEDARRGTRRPRRLPGE